MKRCPYFVGRPRYFNYNLRQEPNNELLNVYEQYKKMKSSKEISSLDYANILKQINTLPVSLFRSLFLINWSFFNNRIDSAKIKLEELLRYEPLELAIGLEYKKYNNPKSFELLGELLKETLYYIDDKVEKEGAVAFCLYLKKFSLDNLNEAIIEQINDVTQRDKDEMLKFSKSFRWGVQYPHIWAEVIFKMFGEKEAEDMLKNYMKLPLKVKKPIYIISFLQLRIPSELRDEIYQFILELKNSNNIFDKIKYYELVGHPELTNVTYHGEKIMSRGEFNNKRAFYSHLLAEKKAKIFSLYQLLRLGDYQKKYLEFLQ
ncbi:MAG: hypothetical protein H6620_04030 [Halobacteriovoraceae bacterium]|nr:hypothetical protein [Halobacteriovoraceae bacterium]